MRFTPKPSTLLAGLVGLGLTAQALAADSLCTNRETTQFSCSAGKKLISVCASKDLNPALGYLQYRFGRKGAPEIQVPAAQNHPNPLVKYGTLTWSGGGGSYLRFLKGDFRYVVYSATGKDGGEKSGVAVEEGGKLITHVKCLGPAQSSIGQKLFEKAGMPADDSPFQIP